MECHENDSTTNFSLQVEDDILEKLRNCSLIPRTLSDFQAFVCRLVDGPVSEAVIQEVWRQIYTTCDLRECLINNDKSTAVLVQSKTKQPMRLYNESQNEITQLPNSHSRGVTNGSNRSNTIVSISNFSFMENEYNGQVNSDDETSSSGCEVVEVVSLNKINSESSSTSDKFGNECNESESDKSVEILELKSCLEVSSDEETFCLVHGNRDFQNSHNFLELHSNYLPISAQKGIRRLDKGTYANQSDNPTNDCAKKKKKIKYRKLKTELKYLKHVLANLLVPDKGTEDKNVTTDHLSYLQNIDFVRKVKRNSQKTVQRELSEEQFEKAEKNIRISKKKCKEKEFKKDLHISYNTFNSAVEKNNSKQIGKSPQKKSVTKDYHKTFHEFFRPSDIIPDTDTFCTGTSKKKRRKFQWRERIAETLKSNPGNKMQIEKLKRKVISKYYYHRGNISQNTTLKFFKYLHSTSGVVIDADVATYVNKHQKATGVPHS